MQVNACHKGWETTETSGSDQQLIGIVHDDNVDLVPAFLLYIRAEFIPPSLPFTSSHTISPHLTSASHLFIWLKAELPACYPKL
jgi:hypothetical protein